MLITILLLSRLYPTYNANEKKGINSSCIKLCIYLISIDLDVVCSLNCTGNRDYNPV